MSSDLDIGDVLRWAFIAPALFLVVLILGLAFLHWTTGEPLERIAGALARVFEARRTVAGLPGRRRLEPPEATPRQMADASTARSLGSADDLASQPRPRHPQPAVPDALDDRPHGSRGLNGGGDVHGVREVRILDGGDELVQER